MTTTAGQGDLNQPIKNQSLMSESSITNTKKKDQLYHCCVGHPSFRVIKLLFPSLFKNWNLHTSLWGELAKHKRVPFPSVSNKISNSLFYLVHTDVWGPSNVSNTLGAKWFITFVDDCTRITWLFILKHKYEISSIVMQLVSLIKNQFGVDIMIIPKIILIIH